MKYKIPFRRQFSRPMNQLSFPSPSSPLPPRSKSPSPVLQSLLSFCSHPNKEEQHFVSNAPCHRDIIQHHADEKSLQFPSLSPLFMIGPNQQQDMMTPRSEFEEKKSPTLPTPALLVEESNDEHHSKKPHKEERPHKKKHSSGSHGHERVSSTFVTQRMEHWDVVEVLLFLKEIGMSQYQQVRVKFLIVIV